jgi:hypothetical protein
LLRSAETFRPSITITASLSASASSNSPSSISEPARIVFDAILPESRSSASLLAATDSACIPASASVNPSAACVSAFSGSSETATRHASAARS